MRQSKAPMVNRLLDLFRLTLIPELKPQIPRISQIFEGVIGGERTNLFVAKLQGIDSRNLLYPCNLLCNLRLNPFRFLVKPQSHR
jgi:hypothetical protein